MGNAHTEAYREFGKDNEERGGRHGDSGHAESATTA